MIIKQKQSNEGESPPMRTREGREYIKEGCQLTEFPTIKLHILQNVQLLNLSNNFINDLSSLQTHSKTSQHVLANLKVVNLSRNKLADALALAPLAVAAKGVVEISIGDNPLTLTLNFLYGIVLMFKQLRRIDSGQVLNLSSDLRASIIGQQLKGGDCISNFIEIIKLKTENLARCLRFKQEILFIQKLLTQLQIEVQDIPSQNSLIFQTIDQYLSFCTPQGDSRRTYRSPRPNNRQTPRQIQAISQYEINSSPNNLLQYLTEADQNERPISLMRFYYQEVTQSTVFQNKILQELELEEAEVERIQKGDLTGFGHEQFIAEVSNKWKQDYGLTGRFAPQSLLNQRPVLNALSPFKSIQTDITSRRQTIQMMRSRQEGQENYFFALDKDWTSQTRRFVTHRLLSLLRLMSQRGEMLELEESQPEAETQNNGQIGQYLSSDNYQTFGSINPAPKSLQIEVKSQSRSLEGSSSMLSPKSRNKYIVGSCINILEQVIRRIVFRKISRAQPIRRQDVSYFMELMQLILKRWLQAGLRRIYQQSLFYECLRKKMERFKKRCVFKAWKMMKRRKVKLLKAILSRKCRKQQAFLLVFTAQWRIAGRNMRLAEKMKQAEEHFKASSKGIEQMSCILKRSSTCQRLTVTGSDRRWTKVHTRGQKSVLRSFMRKLK